jgi:serine/threonine protein kinase
MNDFENLLKNLGLLTLNNLKYEKTLGSGGQGSVCSYIDPHGNSIAVKFLINPQDTAKDRFFEEARALKQCAKLKPAFDTIITSRSDVEKIPDLPIYYFLLDIAPGKSLKDFIKSDVPLSWKWSDALMMIARIASALTQAHIAGFAHRDLHPGNIFIDNSVFTLDKDYDDGNPGIFLLDFGAQADIWGKQWGILNNVDKEFRPIGSVRFASPEHLNDPQSVTLASDMWSLGVLLYYLLSGTCPFNEPTLRKLMDATEKDRYNNPIITNASQDEEKFILKVLSLLLHPDQNKRLSIGQLTKIIYDALFCDSIPALYANSELWENYFSSGGDLWICPRCQNLVHPNGFMCPKCGIRNEDWFPWLTKT